MNTPDEVDRRMHHFYVGKCQVEQFAFDVVKGVMGRAYQAKLSGPSMVLDKSATPGEPAILVRTYFEHPRLAGIVAQRSGTSCADVFDERKFILSKDQALELRTGSEMLNQIRPQYVGMFNMYVLFLCNFVFRHRM